jgi:cytosine/adenosine deaminase-related metal-dependent hydrolase
MCEFVKRAHARGVIAVTGTDNEMPGLALLDEVGLLTECGFTPMAALQAATREAAAAVGVHEIGTIEVDMLADLVILDADPLADPANLRRIWRVIKGGHLHDPAALLGPIAADYRHRMRNTLALRALALGLSLAVVAALVYWLGPFIRRLQTNRDLVRRDPSNVL